MTDGRARGPQVTIKSGAKDGAWLVFAGLSHEVRADIIEAFSLTTSDFEGQPLAQVVKAAESVFQGNGPLTVAKALGGSIVKVEATAPSSGTAPAEGKWSEVAEKPADDHAELLEKIEKAPSQDELRELLKANKAAITDPKVKTAVKARNAALKG